MFLIGGPPFSGTTLLAFLLNQGELVCLDEPDFHDPKQSHRGISLLKKLFPEKVFPAEPGHSLTFEETMALIAQCEAAIAPRKLGIKTCNENFTELAKLYRKSGYPVIAVLRDIRDALVNPLPEWATEADLNFYYRHIWEHLELYDLWIRYENLVQEPEKQLEQIGRVLRYSLKFVDQWDSETVPKAMIKLPRHHLLQSGRISKDRIGIWKNSGKTFSEDSHITAARMGYGVDNDHVQPHTAPA